MKCNKLEAIKIKRHIQEYGYMNDFLNHSLHCLIVQVEKPNKKSVSKRDTQVIRPVPKIDSIISPCRAI